MKIFNECILRAKDITFNLRRLVVQKFNISLHEAEKKFFVEKKIILLYQMMKIMPKIDNFI